jgi:membrane protease YdiL (CAAX protease family)
LSTLPAEPESSLSANDWRRSRWLVLAEFLLIVLIFLSESIHLIPTYVRVSGHWIPVGVVPLLVLLGWISLRLRGLRWRDVGLTKKRSWLRILALGSLAAVALEAIDLFVSQPLLVHLTGRPPNLSGFRPIFGGIVPLLAELAVVWTLAAFGEEMIWRGYLMNRLAEVGKSTRIAWIASMLAVNIAFGLAHSYQGMTGMIDAGFIGLLLGLLYLAAGRDLLVPIVAHGLFDTIAFVMIYLGYYPYM